jgi:hypothetical protein
MHTAICPSCGAPVEFKSAASIFAVCEYCRSTLVRRDREIENLGRMAALLEDASPIRLGTEGRYRGVHFAVIGRIQMRYGRGVWNEWHLLFDDQRTGWLSDAGGEYVVSFAKWLPEALPPFEQLRVEQTLPLDGRPFVVTNLERATCVAGEGELPFKIGAGYEAPVADLRAGPAFATLDYSEAEDGRPPLVFIGEPMPFEALVFANLRDGAAQPAKPRVKAEALRCAACGAALTLHADDIATIACANCTAILDVRDEGLRILRQSQGALTERPVLELGSTGRLRDVEYAVIGYLRRRTVVEGIEYGWREYLLHNPERGFRWLTEYNGHWNFVETVSDAAGLGGGVRLVVAYRGRSFRHFQSAKAEVACVLGEFYWQVSQGDEARVEDYVSPPYVLSVERTTGEVSWSLGEYLEPSEVHKAFRPQAALPDRIGVGANQPSGLEQGFRSTLRLFFAFAAAALVIQLGSWIVAPNRTLLSQRVELAADQETVATQEFVVPKASNLHVRNRADVNNSWVEIGLTLVEKNTGQAYGASREISYYEGVDGGESWSEGSRSDEVVFRAVPAGTYYLTLDADLPPERPAAQDLLEVVRDAPVWSNLPLVLIFLAVFPVLAWMRLNSFETRRWADSDHPRAGSDDDD